MQNEWAKAAESIVSYRAIANSVGYDLPLPIILTNVSCAESREEAQERAMEWLGKKWQSIDNHYHFSDGHLATVKGYETYGKMAKTYARLQSPEERVRATEFYVKIQIVGTPDDCIEQIAELQRVTGTDHVVTEFSFGGIPHDEAEKEHAPFCEPRVARIAARQPLCCSAAAGKSEATTSPDLFAPA
jgi:alkanesulfonate monooxygenase SsuD/methylene tetrahydromethanopterin reductase-like flavin-dependent oxidoreductase (luciferase family)